MSGMLINLIIQIVAGALGGNAAGAASKDMSLGTRATPSRAQLEAALEVKSSPHFYRC